MEIQYPDYQNCIANLSCSILRYFGIEPPNKTLPTADALLQKQYRNVVVLLLDGMGVANMKQHLEKDGFFQKHLVCHYSSTFPPTTVAATTAMDSGLFPNQSAWLGWTGYFEPIDKNVVYFLNTDADTGEPIENVNAAWTYCPYSNIHEKIRRSGAESYFIAPFREPYPKNYHELCDTLRSHCQSDSKKYIYAYWDNPDHLMHKIGAGSPEIRNLMQEFETQTEKLAASLSDTLLIVTADHGHVTIKDHVLTDYPDLNGCLVRTPSIESRALNLFVKKGRETKLKKAFERHFPGKFILFSKQEVLQKNLFGTGTNHSRLESMLGDILAVAVSDAAIHAKDLQMKGEHAGLTDAEMTIPLSAVEKPAVKTENTGCRF